MIAAEVLKKIEAARKAPGNRDARIKEMSRIAFAACIYHDPTASSEGWGDIDLHRFADGSTLTWDGRGYLAHPPVA